MTLSLLVMAAGRARRFGSPKQLVAVGPSGEALVDYAVDTVFGERRLDALPAGIALPAGRVKPWGTRQAVLATGAAAFRAPARHLSSTAPTWYGRSLALSASAEEEAMARTAARFRRHPALIVRPAGSARQGGPALALRHAAWEIRRWTFTLLGRRPR